MLLLINIKLHLQRLRATEASILCVAAWPMISLTTMLTIRLRIPTRGHTHRWETHRNILIKAKTHYCLPKERCIVWTHERTTTLIERTQAPTTWRGCSTTCQTKTRTTSNHQLLNTVYTECLQNLVCLENKTRKDIKLLHFRVNNTNLSHKALRARPRSSDQQIKKMKFKKWKTLSWQVSMITNQQQIGRASILRRNYW